ncbi:hypothetical protein WICPIJ_004801 [Wickerhamomyces pijperi]|uniref:Uncharacterized protein n=1 Tax=Wickerhamomyces pijperi TaxID=599730 RepID=A0A9P8TMK0_WICPI|nr:hypothetical protein WICPIJ_004801 [Wickerhamomyces pijperi]
MSIYFRKSIYDFKNLFRSSKKPEKTLLPLSPPRRQELFEIVLKLFDVTSYSFITLFTVFDHYNHYALEDRAISNRYLNHRELSLARDSIHKIITMLYRRKGEFVKVMHTTVNNKDLIRQQIELVSALLVEFERFVNDLIKISNVVDLNYLVDIYKMDVYYLKFELSPELIDIYQNLKVLNNTSISANCHKALLVCVKVQKIFKLNQPLIVKFHQNLIPLMKFITLRNSISIEFLTIHPELEFLSINDGMNLIDIHDYKIAIARSLEKVHKDLGMLVSKLLNQVESSLDIFFQLSNFYEKDLKIMGKCIILAQTDNEKTENLLKLVSYFIKALKFLYKLSNEYLVNFKEFRATKLTHKEIVIIMKVIYLNCLNSRKLLNDVSADSYQEINYLNRFSNSIDSISIASLRLTELVKKM